MYGFNEFSSVIAVCLWICILGGTKVEANPNVCLTPVEVNWPPGSPSSEFYTHERLSCVRPDFYICEEPSEIVPPEVPNICNYRNEEYHEQVYRWVAGCGCLQFTQPFLFVRFLNLRAGCLHGNTFVPCLEIAKDDGTCGCYPFDPGLEEVIDAVRNALVPTAHGRWERCVYAASDCCTNYMVENSNQTNSSQCPVTFDGWTCWQAADAGTVANEVCPEFAYSGQGPVCHHFSNKECYYNSKWEMNTDYSTCSITPRLIRRYQFYIIVLSISIATCLPAVFVFFFYKRLRITRVALHRNLLITIIIRNVLVIVSRSVIYLDELTSTGDTVMATNGVACRVLAVAERVAGNAVFICMLVIGIYLHRLIVAVFRKKLNILMLYGIGTAFAIIPVVAWAIVMGLHNDHSCWLVYTVPHIQWIIDAPRILILLINTGLFIDVLRVLLTKIRNSENANQLSTAKATLFLMPIFGVQFILTAIRPNTTNCTAEQIYYYISYTVEGLQGFIVAMLYCYVNKEVHMLVKSTYKKTESAVVSRVRGESSFARMSLAPNSDRRMTFSTAVPMNDDDLKDPDTTMRPSMDVAEVASLQATEERLAAILEPAYESIDNDISNENYDTLDRSQDFGNHSGFKSNRKLITDENSQNAGSTAYQDGNLHIMSPSSSVYDNSMIDRENSSSENEFHNPRNENVQHIKLDLGTAYETIDSGISNEGYDFLEKAQDTGNNAIFKAQSETDENVSRNTSNDTTDYQDWNRDILSASSSIYDNSMIDREDSSSENEFPKPRNENIQQIKLDYGKNAPKIYQNDIREQMSDESDYEEVEDEMIQYMENRDSNNKPVILDPNLLCPYKKGGDDKIIFIEDEIF